MRHDGGVSDFNRTVRPTWCSALSENEPGGGTAAHESVWVLLEYPGGWGRDILDGEALGQDLADRLRAHLKACGARMLFIRRPGRLGVYVERPRLYVCQTTPGARSVRVTTVGGPADLLDLDLSTPAGLSNSEPVHAPIALVCVHGRRDQCCAVRGRPVAAQLQQTVGQRLRALDPAAGVWECSHTSGHRFAPVLLLASTGYTYGSGDIASYIRAVEAELDGKVTTADLRGRSTWPPLGQVAEIAVRDSGVAAGIDELTVDVAAARSAEEVAVGERRELTVSHSDGRRWTVEAERVSRSPLPASCGKDPVVAEVWRAESVRPR